MLDLEMPRFSINSKKNILDNQFHIIYGIVD
jgi:hypothetical protein